MMKIINYKLAQIEN